MQGEHAGRGRVVLDRRRCVSFETQHFYAQEYFRISKTIAILAFEELFTAGDGGGGGDSETAQPQNRKLDKIWNVRISVPTAMWYSCMQIICTTCSTAGLLC